MIDRATKADQQLMPISKAVHALPQSHKRHCAAPGFTDSGQRRFSTHFSTQRGNTAESMSYFSWSQWPDEVANPGLLPASQAGNADPMNCSMNITCWHHDPVLDPEFSDVSVRARASTVAVTAAARTFSSGCDSLPGEMVCWLMSMKLCPAVIMIQVTEALPGSRSMEISARHAGKPRPGSEAAWVVTYDRPFDPATWDPEV